MKLSILIVMLTATSILGNDEEDFLYEGNLQHQLRLSGLQFHLKTLRWLEGDYEEFNKVQPNWRCLFGYKKPTEFRETLAIRFNPADADNPWRTRWLCEYPEAPEEPSFMLRAFFVLDDSHLRTMVRPDYRLVGELDIENHEKYFQMLKAGAQVLPKSYARLDSAYFDLVSHVMLVNAKMRTIYKDKTGDVCRHLDGWRVASRGKFLGRDSVRLEYQSNNPIEAAYLILLAAPEFTVVEFNATERTSKGVFSTMRLETTALGAFNGITYPSAGTVAAAIRFSQEGDVWSHVSQFEVSSVEKIPATVLANWVPKVPPGANFIENDRITSIPFDEQFRISALHRAATATSESSSFPFFRILFIVLGVVGFAFWRKWRNAS